MTENALDLDALAADCDQHEVSRWVADGSEIYRDEYHMDWIGETCDIEALDYGDANAAFIVQAVQAVPALIARVRELEAAQKEGEWEYATTWMGGQRCCDARRRVFPWEPAPETKEDDSHGYYDTVRRLSNDPDVHRAVDKAEREERQGLSEIKEQRSE